jgi:hypothetical protein
MTTQSSLGFEPARTRLEDKYTLQSGRIYLSGIQALVRLPMHNASATVWRD